MDLTVVYCSVIVAFLSNMDAMAVSNSYIYSKTLPMHSRTTNGAKHLTVMHLHSVVITSWRLLVVTWLGDPVMMTCPALRDNDGWGHHHLMQRRLYFCIAVLTGADVVAVVHVTLLRAVSCLAQ